MIRVRKHLATIERSVQNFNNREDWMRLDMNEYVPYANSMLYQKLLERLTPELLSAYPMVNEAYEELANYLNVSEEKLVLTEGSDGVIFSVLQAFCDPGDKIAYIAPTYGMYEIYAKMLALKYTEVHYNKDLTLSKESILDLVEDDLKVILLANPNGVFGTSLSFEFLIELIKKANKTGTIILIDEVYADFIDGGRSRFIECCDLYDNVVIARSFSKSYGAAGVRLGYSISNKETRKHLIAVRKNVEINSVAVELLKVWIKHPNILKDAIEEINKSKFYFAQMIRKKGFELVMGEGNFILVKIDNDKFFNYLQNNKVSVKKLDYYDKQYLRITIGTMKYMRRFQNILQVYEEDKG